MPGTKKQPEDPDLHKGAVESDRPDQEHQANRDAPALTPDGLPADPVAIAQERLGANVDDSEVAQASETGQSADGLRYEEQELEQLSASVKGGFVKTFIVTLLLGVVLGAGGVLIWQQSSEVPGVQDIESRVGAASAEATRAAANTAIDLRGAVADKLEALQLRAADLRDELDRGGQVVRRRAKALGQSATDTTTDARASIAIKAKLAADPELSAMAIEVNTTNGLVTLAGTAPSIELIGRAILLAIETDGVDEVASTLQVG